MPGPGPGGQSHGSSHWRDLSRGMTRNDCPGASARKRDADVFVTTIAMIYGKAGRVIARAFYDELNKIAVSAHGYTPSEAEDQRANPAVQVAFAPERLENTMKAVQILEQLTAGERVHGTEGYIQVNGQPTEPTQPEIPVEEHPLAIDVDKRASAEIVSAVYQHLFGE